MAISSGVLAGGATTTGGAAGAAGAGTTAAGGAGSTAAGGGAVSAGGAGVVSGAGAWAWDAVAADNNRMSPSKEMALIMGSLALSERQRGSRLVLGFRTRHYF